MNTKEDPAASYDVTQFERPSVTVDIVIFTLHERRLQALLIQRKSWPFEGQWAIPGGFVRMDETLDDAARRELEEETGVAGVYLEQLHTFGDPGRDPRTRVITVAYTALIPSDKQVVRAATDAAEAAWFPIDDRPRPLAFDHETILDFALGALRERLETTSVARGLLPERFTLTTMQQVYEAILGRPLDKRNFRKSILASGMVAPTAEQSRGHHRPAQLFIFSEKPGQKLK